MVRNWLPLRSGNQSVGSSINTPSSSDTASVTSDFSQWTTTSTVQGDNDASTSPDNLQLSLHPLATQDGLIVKVTPPKAPVKPVAHVPCDIVLVIDVSGSMGDNAPIPANPGEKAENYGLSILDLVKHASKTILETLDEGDRLGIVTFGSDARILQKLTPMDSANKKTTVRNIESMHPTSATNLWQGFLSGVNVFKDAGETNTGRVPAIFILTDGMPNYMCPPQGYVPKIRGMEQLPASVHTFGFGYNLRSGLLKSIAEIGGGNYAFIPDAGMIGTVFVHAVANLQATYATNAVLRLTYPSELELTETTGASVDKQEPLTLSNEEGKPRQLSILLGNIQYGQSRDIYLNVKGVKNVKPESAEIMASLEYSQMTNIVQNERATQSFAAPTSLSETEIAYHISRSQICSFLADIFPLRSDGEHQAVPSITQDRLKSLQTLITELPAQKFSHDPKNKALLEDLSGPEPKGQITLALKNPKFYLKWGLHYLPSLLNAHTRQICNTFKDSGPLQYGADSPLFISCRDKLDNAFDNLPAPKPSNQRTATHRGHISMSSYNRASGVCFAASTPVELASGDIVPINSLRKGTAVSTPHGPRQVVAILKTRVTKESMCRVGSLIVTQWHPISLDNGNTWTFPAEVATREVQYTGFIYSILLQADNEPGAHSLQLVDGILGVTLGHGLLSGEDIRAHSFFGSYNAVARGLKAIGIDRKTGIASGTGVRRNPQTGLVNGFKKARKLMLVDRSRSAKARLRIQARTASRIVV